MPKGNFLRTIGITLGITFETLPCVIQCFSNEETIFSLKTYFMKRILLMVLSVVSVITLYAQDNGQDRPGVSGGVLGAVNITQFRIPGESNVEYDAKASWGFGGWLNLPLSSRFSIEPQLMYNSYQYFTSSTTPMLLNDGRIRYVSVPVALKLNAGDKFAIIAGPQIDFLTGVRDNDNRAQESDFNQTSLSLFGGFELFPRSRVTLFGRYIHGLSDMDNRAEHLSTVELNNQAFQFGLKLRLFGGRDRDAEVTSVATVPDSDGDGIADDVDKCPNQFGLAKYNGCPIPDSDGDGINDEEDKCPNQAGIAKYNGCPIPDSDGDGINDEEDKCPNQAGIAANQGCPVSDRDNDGISDAEDLCPDVAGIAANKGCPEVPANVSKSLGTIGSGIKFTGRTATLSHSSHATLDRLVALMNENPGLRIRIEGHTDNVGEEDANEDLSSERAKAVMDYLISKGIDDDRVSKEGFGETQPIADNNTAAGRAKNNRIEIRIDY